VAKFNHTHEPPARHKTPLPPERLTEIGFVFDGQRVIAPWPRGGLTWGRERDLLAVLARIDALQPDRVVWIWPDPTREPVPVEHDDPRWLTRWAADRASYVARRS
jgi:hypothetical protein